MMISRIVLSLVFIEIFFIDRSENSQCGFGKKFAGHCGCCPLIGGTCRYFDTIDQMDVSWHLCLPENRRDNFSLDQCKPKPFLDRNGTRLCRTRNETFRLFPQCVTKDVCSLPLSKPRKLMSKKLCTAPMAVVGSCNQTLKQYTYDSIQNSCVAFNYSGCGGTINRFIRLDRCEKLCKKKH